MAGRAAINRFFCGSGNRYSRSLARDANQVTTAMPHIASRRSIQNALGSIETRTAMVGCALCPDRPEVRRERDQGRRPAQPVQASKISSARSNALGRMTPISLSRIARRPCRRMHGWWSNPITTVFTVKGCAYECVTCGSSHTTCTQLTKRQRPVYRSPASLVENMKAICRLARGPIILVSWLAIRRWSVAVIAMESISPPPGSVSENSVLAWR